MHTDFSQIAPFFIAAVVLFAVYRRFRRTFGQQPLQPLRMRIRSVILLMLSVATLALMPRSTAFFAAAGIGAILGTALASWGAARTRFLKVDSQLYYVPHTYTGVAVSLLFLGRLAYRLIQAYGGWDVTGGGGAPPPQYASAGMLRSPLTLGLFFVLVGYYVYYYGAVLWKSKRIVPDEVSPTLDPASQQNAREGTRRITSG
jgi:hypothetical protein